MTKTVVVKNIFASENEYLLLNMSLFFDNYFVFKT